MRTNILNQEQKSALALLKSNAEVGKFYLFETEIKKIAP
ncbi:MAG: hypothetical protein ALAOOOJD_04700 [bacterium]|nr:hypothetical protein [bacterium]